MAGEHEVSTMRRALVLAARGLGRTSPNPVVGCVILAPDGAVAGEGWHERAGGPHAEVAALAAAGQRAAGGTAVVTLEPCAHTGRTGPCAEALLAAGVRRVVFAVGDPNPQARGGAEVLRAGGVDVEGGVLAAEAEQVNEAWLHATRAGRPFVTWKYAASLDGQVAAADGTSQWITSEEARADVHRLRAEVDAIAVGVGTVLADDPALTARLPGETRSPLRVVLDSHGRTPRPSRVLPAVVFVAPGQDTEPDQVPVPSGSRGLDLAAALAHLHGLGVRHLLVEGGPTLAGSFLYEGLVDRVVGYVAPALLTSGRWPTVKGEGVRSIDEALRLRLDDVTRLGPDLRLTARPLRQRVA